MTLPQICVVACVARRSDDDRPEIMRSLVLALLHGYKRFISPLLPPMCRFEPTCSVYAADAVARYGVIRGSWLAARRLLRCHPLNPGGWDPVP